MKHLTKEEFQKQVQMRLEKAKRRKLLEAMMQTQQPPMPGQGRLASILGGGQPPAPPMGLPPGNAMPGGF